jgi:hypothetical protein
MINKNKIKLQIREIVKLECSQLDDRTSFDLNKQLQKHSVYKISSYLTPNESVINLPYYLKHEPHAIKSVFEELSTPVYIESKF